MPLYAVMRSAISGMQAQSSRLSAVAENIANTDTIGYKRAQAELFSNALSNTGGQLPATSGVRVAMTYDISGEGTPISSESSTDISISGSGFFLVKDEGNAVSMTRAGRFDLDAQGRLTSPAGLRLQGYEIDAQGKVESVANGTTSLKDVKINVGDLKLEPKPTTTGTFATNLPSTTVNKDANGQPAAAQKTGNDLPSANNAAAKADYSASLVTYDKVGNPVKLDVYFTRTTNVAADRAAAGAVPALSAGGQQWDVAVYDSSKRASGGTFPYTDQADSRLYAGTLQFDLEGNLADNAFVGVGAATAATADTKKNSPTEIQFAIPGGEVTKIDLSNMQSVAAEFSSAGLDFNGAQAAEPTRQVAISADGTVSVVFSDGSSKAQYRIPLADVPNPNGLDKVTGNAFRPTIESGNLKIGFTNTNGLGSINPQTVEQANVKLGEELTKMIQSQRSYTANTKSFQTSSELLQQLVNLKR